MSQKTTIKIASKFWKWLKHIEVYVCVFRCHSDRRRRKLQSGSETAVLSGQSLRQEKQYPYHGRSHSIHRHGNGECVIKQRASLRQRVESRCEEREKKWENQRKGRWRTREEQGWHKVHAVIFICGHGNKENEGKADRLNDLWIDLQR